ncbi:MAG: TetR/AcrR family transcriptional regulator [Candidatus Limnocylindria bacterium]
MVRRRRYRLGRRAETVAATRRRIVEATLTLHNERGITRTSARDVAGRAGVSPATVLSHFPRMGDLIRACGQLSDHLYPMPTDAVLIGARDRVERVRRVAEALFSWWDQMASGWEHLQVDRRTLPEVDAWLRDVDARHRALVAEALEMRADAASVAIGTALTSFGSWRSLRDAGMDVPRAASEVARFLAGEPAGPTNPTLLSRGRVH